MAGRSWYKTKDADGKIFNNHNVAPTYHSQRIFLATGTSERTTRMLVRRHSPFLSTGGVGETCPSLRRPNGRGVAEMWYGWEGWGSNIELRLIRLFAFRYRAWVGCTAPTTPSWQTSCLAARTRTASSCERHVAIVAGWRFRGWWSTPLLRTRAANNTGLDCCWARSQRSQIRFAALFLFLRGILNGSECGRSGHLTSLPSFFVLLWRLAATGWLPRRGRCAV